MVFVLIFLSCASTKNILLTKPPKKGPKLVFYLFAASATKRKTNNLVDPASSHMLVSKIKPCMSKNKPQNGESANGSLNQLLFI